MPSLMFLEWVKSHELQAPLMQDGPVLYRNIEARLDQRRATHAFWGDTWKDRDALDFSSNDTLSLGTSGLLRAEFMDEIARNPTINISSGGPRSLPDGRYAYIEQVEQEIADFHGAESGLIVGSGFEANVAIFSSIPQAGDVIVYDEMIHASTHDGMRKSRAEKISFLHNNVESFHQALLSALNSSLIHEKKRSVIVAVESLYSMDGDICPLKELVEVARRTMENVFFVVDEAHSTGVFGPNGAGLVNSLGLEKEIDIRLHTCGKALAANGAIVLGKKTIRDALTTFARPVVFSTSPSFPFVAMIRSGYNLLRSGETRSRQDNIQSLVKLFFKSIASDPTFQKAVAMGILSVPLIEGWEERPTVSPVVPVWTRPGYNYQLFGHLALAKICAFCVQYPVVPKEHPRVRLVFRASHTERQVEYLVSAICQWAREMIAIEESGDNATDLHWDARRMHALTKDSRARL